MSKRWSLKWHCHNCLNKGVQRHAVFIVLTVTSGSFKGHANTRVKRKRGGGGVKKHHTSRVNSSPSLSFNDQYHPKRQPLPFPPPAELSLNKTLTDIWALPPRSDLLSRWRRNEGEATGSGAAHHAPLPPLLWAPRRREPLPEETKQTAR